MRAVGTRWVTAMVWLVGAWSARAEPAENVSSAVVLVQLGDATCSGVAVSPEGHILTSYHCIADGGRPRVATREGNEFKAEVLARLPRRDLALLRVDGATLPYALVQGEAPTQGQAVDVWGHPFGGSEPGGFLEGTLRWSTSNGVISAVGPWAIQVSAPVNPGNSGGPVFDASGRVVGIVSRKLSGDGLGFASRVDDLAEDLDALPRGSAIGGSVRAGVIAAMWGGGRGVPSGGLQLELSVRDRFVTTASASTAFSPEWDAVRFGAAEFPVAEWTGGLRQRLFREAMTIRADAYFGVAWLHEITAVGGNDPLRTTRVSRFRPLVGGRLEWGSLTVDIAASPPESGRTQAWTPRTMVRFNWPGRLAVY